MRTYQPGPQGHAPAVTWRQWLLPLGAAAGIVALATMSRGTPLSYSRFLADVGAGSVRAVTIDPAGQVVGRLTTGQPFTTTIPVALDDRTLAGRLAAHHVQVTATAAMPSSPVPLLIGLLLLVMIGGLFYVGVRGARRDIGGLRGPPGPVSRVTIPSAGHALGFTVAAQCAGGARHLDATAFVAAVDSSSRLR